MGFDSKLFIFDVLKQKLGCTGVLMNPREISDMSKLFTPDVYKG